MVWSNYENRTKTRFLNWLIANNIIEDKLKFNSTITIDVDKVSESAKAKIEKAGGSVKAVAAEESK